MFATLRKRFASITIAAFYALAMVTLGVAHQSTNQHQSSIELAKYNLPDGSVPVLCSSDAGSTDEDPTVPKPACCNACTLISGPGIAGELHFVGSNQIASLTRFSLDSYAYQPIVRASDNFLSRAPPGMA